MKTENRQTSPLGRSTKKKNAGYHSCVNPLFEFSGNTFIYYNESPFIANLKRVKFAIVRFFQFRHLTQSLHFSIILGCFPKTVKHNGMTASVSHSTHQLDFNF